MVNEEKRILDCSREERESERERVREGEIYDCFQEWAILLRQYVSLRDSWSGITATDWLREHSEVIAVESLTRPEQLCPKSVYPKPVIRLRRVKTLMAESSVLLSESLNCLIVMPLDPEPELPVREKTEWGAAWHQDVGWEKYIVARHKPAKVRGVPSWIIPRTSLIFRTLASTSRVYSVQHIYVCTHTH